MGYSLVTGLRNRLYDAGCLNATRLDVPVICLGNITVGGTGKTPMVVWLCQQLQKRSRRPAILTRGYKASATGDNDEVKLLRNALPDVPVVVDSDRVRAGRHAVAEHHADVLVMDDGFQHRRLGRDLDIVLVDSTCPFGFGAVLPRGLLRESLTQLRRARAVVLTRADQVLPAELDEIRQQVESRLNVSSSTGLSGPKPILTGRHEPRAIVNMDGHEEGLAQLQGRRVFAFCGIGNPEAFVATLATLGADVVGRRFFDDHHHYRAQDCRDILQAAQQERADWLLTTQKDSVKLEQFARTGALPLLYWLAIENRIDDPRPLDRLIDGVLEGPTDAPSPRADSRTHSQRHEGLARNA